MDTDTGFYARVYDLHDAMYIHLSGRLNVLENIEHFEELYRQYENDGKDNVILNLRRVKTDKNGGHKSLDTAVLSILVKFRREVEKRGGKLEVYLTKDQLKIFDLTGCKRLFKGCLVRGN